MIEQSDICGGNGAFVENNRVIEVSEEYDRGRVWHLWYGSKVHILIVEGVEESVEISNSVVAGSLQVLLVK